MINTKKYNVLISPSWYPNKDCILSANFIQKHVNVIAEKNNIAVAYAHGTADLKKTFDLVCENINGVETIVCYYKLNKIPVIKTIINGFRYFIAHCSAISKGYKGLGKIDFIHVHVLTRAAIIPFFMKVFMNIPYFISEQSTRYVREGGFNGYFRKLLTMLIVKKSLGISVISEALRDGMNSHKLIHENFFIIPNCVNNQIFYPSHDKNKNDSRWRFLHVSRLEQKAKNVKGILDSIKLLGMKNQQVELHIVGDGPERIEMEAYRDSLELTNVLFHGNLHGVQLVEQYHKADLFILFSNYETQAVVVTEALFCGLPVIATKLPALQEYLHEENSKLVNVNDKNSLVLTLLDFIDGKLAFWGKDKISEEAYQRFSNDCIKQKFIEFYSLINAKKNN